jgi:16S rRNA (guanine966-N2)-methyltransferase
VRIISGKYKNRTLFTTHSKTLRPTSSSARKSIFQILEPFDNLKILDLFSGIGSLGIESLSRGAKHITFVEKNPKVISFLAKNLKKLQINDQFLLIRDDVNNYLKKCDKKYDIIFADPPYESVDFKILLPKVSNLLNQDGIFCMEKKYENKTFHDVRIKNFGKTQFLLWKKN